MMRRRRNGASTVAALAALLNAVAAGAQEPPPPPAPEPVPAPAAPGAELPSPSPAPPTAVLPPAVSPVQQAPVAPSEAAINAAWGPRLVRVRVGDVEGMGVVFGPPKHVLTAYRLVNRSGKLQVTFANGTYTRARVVGWNAASGLALLELAAAPLLAPVPLAARAPQIGDAVLSPDLVATAPAQGDTLPPAVAVLGGGRVSGRLDESLWVDMPLFTVDLGRPIVASDGALLGIVIGDADDAPGDNRLSWHPRRARVAGPGALAAIAGQPHTPGTFEPESHTEWSGIYGAIVVPLASNGVQGAALQFGYRYGLFVFLVREGFAMTGFAPKSDFAFERVHNRFFFEAELELQFPVFSRSVVWLGAGGVYLSDGITRRELDGAGNVFDSKRHDTRVRPLFGLGINDFGIEFAVQGYEDHGPAGRVGLGIAWGRR